MAETDRDLASLTLDEIAALPAEQFEILRRAALAQIAFNPKEPAAARVAALKDLAPGEGTGNRGPENDPGTMSLDDIDRELASLNN